MNAPLVCKNEGSALLELKVKFMEISQRRYQRGDKEGCMKLLELFDCMPELGPENQVDQKHTVCTFPNCPLTKGLRRLDKKLGLNDLEQVEDALNKLGYEHSSSH